MKTRYNEMQGKAVSLAVRVWCLHLAPQDLTRIPASSFLPLLLLLPAPCSRKPWWRQPSWLQELGSCHSHLGCGLQSQFPILASTPPWAWWTSGVWTSGWGLCVLACLPFSASPVILCNPIIKNEIQAHGSFWRNFIKIYLNIWLYACRNQNLLSSGKSHFPWLGKSGKVSLKYVCCVVKLLISILFFYNIHFPSSLWRSPYTWISKFVSENVFY